MNTKSNTAENIRWDLSSIYSDITDPQIDKDIAAFVWMAKSFYDDHKGKLATALGKAISDYSEISMLETKFGVYLFLAQSTNVSDAVIKAKVAKTDNILSTTSGQYLTFFDIELVALDDVVLTRLFAADPIVARHRPWIEHIRLYKPHLLSEPVESALVKRAPFGPGAWGEFFNELESDLEFEFRGKKKILTEMLHILTESKDPEERAEAMKIINAGFSGAFAKYSAQTLYMVAGAQSVESKERSYRHPMEFRNKSNQIPDAVVDLLHEVVETVAGPLTKRYYQLKAAHLGLEKLKWSDRNAPMPFSDTADIPFSEAMKTVVAAYKSFSPTLAKLVEKIADEKWIDVPAVKGKRGGAYDYSLMLPGNIPASFVFLNYLGSNRDVMTLAHELGHGVHGLLAAQAQGPLMFRAPIAFAETASVFGEMTTFNFLKKQLAGKNDKQAMLALIMGKIDDMQNTVVRQIGFSNFERRLHGMDASYQKWNELKKYSVEELDAIWLETAKRLYGEDGEVFTYENSEHLWAYISHFHRSFYVYGYAFGELLTQSLYAKQSRIGDRFEPLYLDLLRSGSTKNVVELLRPFGLDPMDRQFWVDGINSGLGALIKEAEQLSGEMGISVK